MNNILTLKQTLTVLLSTNLGMPQNSLQAGIISIEMA